MGPQHPSTHGVLRLILELEGETVTEARCGIGYLHTGIEKNMEFRTWVQGVTFCTRMDYLSPFYNEMTYCLGVERLLDIEDGHPREGAGHARAPDGAQPDLLPPRRDRHRRHGDRRADRDDDRLPRARAGARPVRADHRPADEPRVHPSRRRRAGHARRRPGPDPRLHRADEEAPARVRRPLQRQPDLQGPPRWTSATSTSPAAWPSASPGRCCARPATRGTCARASPTPATRTTTSTSRPGTPWTPTAGSGSGSTRCGSRCASSSRPSTGSPTSRARPVMVGDKKIAWPSQLAIGSDGMGNSLDHIKHIMGESMEALIHHFKLVTEGFRVPAGQAYVPVESPRGELGAHVVSDGGTRPFRAHFRDPSFVNLQAHLGDERGRHGGRRDRRDRLHRPGDGRCRQMSERPHPRHRRRHHRRRRLDDPGRPGDPLDPATYAELEEIAARYPQARSGLLPMLHLVQSVEGRVTSRGIEACAEILGHQRRRGERRGDLLHDVQAPPRRRLPRRRLHQHALRDHGRRPDLRAAQGPPRHRQRRDHRGRQGHPRAHRVQRRLRLRAGDDGQLGVHGQHDPGVGRRSWSTTCARAPRCTPPAGRGWCTWREAERVLAGFPDGLADEGPSAGPASLVGPEDRPRAGLDRADGAAGAGVPARGRRGRGRHRPTTRPRAATRPSRPSRAPRSRSRGADAKHEDNPANTVVTTSDRHR